MSHFITGSLESKGKREKMDVVCLAGSEANQSGSERERSGKTPPRQ
jgi:hypothetical protein